MGHEEHHKKSTGPVACFVLTVSDTRDAATDTSGTFIREALLGAGHTVTGSEIVPDDAEAIRAAVAAALPSGAQAMIITGGTGISRRDTTVEAVRPFLVAELPGFGELFRALSFNEIGPAAMMSRATAGITTDRRVIFCLPGSVNAVRLAVEKLIIPELAHVVWEANR